MIDQLPASGEAEAFSELLLPRLYERDIDDLLQAELIFNPAVARVFSSALHLPGSLEGYDCRLSVSDHTGETDVFALFRSGERQGLILIENKIDAAFQPRRPERRRLSARFADH